MLLSSTSLFVFLIISVSLCLQFNFANAGEIYSQIYSPNSSPYNIAYQEWPAKWWQWHMSIPADVHPRENYLPERCGLNQDGPVWFLPDGPNNPTQQVRTCVIPSDKSILIQVVGGECDYEEETNKNDEDVKLCIASGNDGARVFASVDGSEIKNFSSYKSGYHWFNITIPDKNVYDAVPGTYRAAVDGWFLFLKPLPVGEHKLVLKGDVDRIGLEGQPTDEDRHSSVLYKLKIIP
jgi:hypothetical protein